MTKAKGYCDLVRSIPKVAKEFDNVSFYFAGTLREGERGVFFNQINGEPIIYENPFTIHNDIRKSKYKNNYKYLGVISGEKKLNILKKNKHFCPSFIF